MGTFEDTFTAAFWGEEVFPLPDWVKWKHISEGLTHCPVYLKLDKCWFVDDAKPLLPQHPHCHCIVESISTDRVEKEANAECRISKFEGYIFNPKYDYNGKRKLFEGWGYDIMDSEWLQKEFERQALEKYIRGEYVLKKLDKEGQRIDVEVKLPDRNKNRVITVISGWMIRPSGQITLNTPLGDR